MTELYEMWIEKLKSDGLTSSLCAIMILRNVTSPKVDLSLIMDAVERHYALLRPQITDGWEFPQSPANFLFWAMLGV